MNAKTFRKILNVILPQEEWSPAFGDAQTFRIVLMRFTIHCTLPRVNELIELWILFSQSYRK